MAPPLDHAGRLGLRKVRAGRLGAIRWLPAVAAGIYPFLLHAFHLLLGPPGADVATPRLAAAVILLLAAFLVPVVGMACAASPAQASGTRRLAYTSVAAPTLYVFLGVVQSMAKSPFPDELIWCLIWLAAAIGAETARDAGRAASLHELARWRVSHGAAGAMV